MVFGALAPSIAPGRIRDAFDGAGTEGEVSEIWGQLGAHVLERTASASGWVALLVGMGVVGGMAVVQFIRRR